jgi:hypothetical protein
MHIVELKNILTSFAEDPHQIWGVGTDDFGNHVNINHGELTRFPITQGDRNTARIISGTYTQEQSDAYTRHELRVGPEHAHFSGDPYSLPDSVPERNCLNCGQSFRTQKANEQGLCYSCTLDVLCPPDPYRRITCFCSYGLWTLEAFGDEGISNEVKIRWYNRDSFANLAHQSLVVQRDKNRNILKLIFSTYAESANRRYEVIFDIAAGTTKFQSKQSFMDSRDQDVTPIEDLDPVVLDLMIAMFPTWMLYAHRPLIHSYSSS